MHIAFAAAELTPWVSTGGLGEVAAALPKALAALGHQVAVFVPLYRQVRTNVSSRGARLVDTGAVSHVWLGGHRIDARIFRIETGSRADKLQTGEFDAPDLGHGALHTYAVDCPVLFDRDGVYGHSDDAARYSTFARVVLNTAEYLLGGKLDIVHAHDWHAALLPVYLAGPYRHRLPHTRSVLTIHNLAYQGTFPLHELGTIGLDASFLHGELLEFYGHLNWLKAGIATADAVTTVSPRYAEEIRTPEFGERLDGVLKRHAGKLFGILNGIDTAVWNPATDKYLAHKYTAQDMAGKDGCRRAVLRMAKMDGDDWHPVLGVVSRLSKQKGLDLLAELVPYLASRSVRVILLGKGEPPLENRWQELENRFHGHVRVRIGFEPDLAHVLQAGADMIAMPSRYEPCGLTQLYAMRYGTLPVVRAVGGLFDSVVPATNRTVAEKTATGFTYEHDTAAGLQWALDRALDVYYTQRDVWRQMQQTAMAQDFSWRTSAHKYVEVYRLAHGGRR